MTVLDRTEIEFLRRIANSEVPIERNAGTTARHFHEHFRLGTPRGRAFDYSLNDIDQARGMLRSRKIPTTEPSASDGIRDRAASSTTPGMTEKSGSETPWSGQVAIKAVTPGCVLEGIALPVGLPGVHLLHYREAVAIEAEAVIVVENFETMKQLHRYRWIIESEVAKSKVFALYRGEHHLNITNASKVLEDRSDDVWAFPDLDPSGLGHASQLPRLKGLVLPWSRVQERLDHLKRSDLFDPQEKQWSRTLDGAANADIRRAWAMVKHARFGLNQEALRF